MDQLPIFSLIIDENDEVTGVNTVSFVDYPAIERNFIALEKQPSKLRLNSEDKQWLTGPVLIPDFDIFRMAEAPRDYYYIRFSAYEIEKIMMKFMRNGYTRNTNQQHSIELDNNYVVESWIITDFSQDKAKALGFDELPVGTWMMTYHVPDKEYWDSQVKAGIVKGFSIEGVFNEIEQKMKRDKSNIMAKKESGVLAAIRKLVFGVQKYDFMDYKAKDGTMIWVEEGTMKAYKVLEDGSKEALADGSYDLEDGTVLVVKEGIAVMEMEGQKPDETKVEATVIEFVLLDGRILCYDEETLAAYFIAEDGTQSVAEDGEYELADNSGKVLIKDGKFVQVLEMKAEEVDMSEVNALLGKIEAIFGKQKNRIDQLEEKLSKQGKAIAKLEKSFEEFSKAPAAKPMDFSKKVEAKEEKASRKKLNMNFDLIEKFNQGR